MSNKDSFAKTVNARFFSRPSTVTIAAERLSGLRKSKKQSPRGRNKVRKRISGKF